MSYGVIKMNIDTDTQYAFTRPVAGHMFSNYDGVLKVDGEVGNKKTYDPAFGVQLQRQAWPHAWSRLASSSVPSVPPSSKVLFARRSSRRCCRV